MTLVKERKNYLSKNTSYWGMVYSNVFEIQKYKITIDFLEDSIIKSKIRPQIKPFLDLITYWILWNRKSKEKISSEIKSFAFHKNKDQRKVINYYHQLSQIKLRLFVKSIKNREKRWEIAYSLPLILYDKLIKYYSLEEMEELGKWFNIVSPKYIWINQLQDGNDSLIQNLRSKLSIKPVEFVTNAFSIGKGQPIQHFNEFDEGKLIIQDIGAMIVTQIIPQITKGRVIDLCASPGNKTVQIMDLFKKFKDVEIYASDLPGSRFNLLSKRLQFLLGLKNDEANSNDEDLIIEYKNRKIYLMPRDATNLSFNDKYFNLIFIDAPCTGSGTLGTKPDTRLLIDEQFIKKHVELQSKILDEGHRVLNNGGFIFYATCSLLEEENELQIKNFMNKYKEYNLIQLTHKLASKSKLIPETIRLYPPKSKSEGFFACLLEKKQY